MVRELVTVNVPSLLINYALMMKAIRASETSVHTGATHHVPEHCTLHSHRRENLSTYVGVLTSMTTNSVRPV
jgi:hypothetical protein